MKISPISAQYVERQWLQPNNCKITWSLTKEKWKRRTLLITTALQICSFSYFDTLSSMSLDTKGGEVNMFDKSINDFIDIMSYLIKYWRGWFVSAITKYLEYWTRSSQIMAVYIKGRFSDYFVATSQTLDGLLIAFLYLTIWSSTKELASSLW